jgi:hypothetical protein
MGISVTSWFIDQTNLPTSVPKRVFLLGTSDYSDRVVKWPSIKRTGTDLKPVNPTIRLANNDGALNFFFNDIFTIPLSGESTPYQIQWGFTHPTSGDELINAYTGLLKTVQYKNDNCLILARDKLSRFEERALGDSDTALTLTGNPADIMWTLTTCYGGFSSIESTSNPDINYTRWQTWQTVNSDNAVNIEIRAEGDKIREIGAEILRQSLSFGWIDGAGVLQFEAPFAASSLDTIFTDDDYSRIDLNVDESLMINKQWMFGNYDNTSREWGFSAFDINSSSVESFGVHDNVIKSTKVWHTTSASALGIAERRVLFFAKPVKDIALTTRLAGIERELSETIRLVNSFYQVDSSTPYRLFRQDFNINNMTIKYDLDTATIFEVFRLNIDPIESEERLMG